MITFLGSGLSPVAPGTAGSLLASLLLLSTYQAAWSISYLAWQVILIIGLGVAGVLTIGLAPWAILHFGSKDPQPCVLDEVAGICLTNLFLPIYSGRRELWAIATAFVAFRLFDVTKPPPARQLERLPAGWGILFDDLAAAVYANIACQLLLRLALNKLI